MSNVTALMLQAISAQLKEKIIPDLASAEAIERATLSAQVLQYLAADIDALAKASVNYAPEMRRVLAEVLASLPKEHWAKEHDNWQRQLDSIAPETDLACQREIRSLRNLSAQILRACNDRCDAPLDDTARHSLEKIVTSLGQQDLGWLDAFDTASEAVPDEAPGDSAAEHPETAVAAGTDLNTELVTGYLRQHYGQSPNIRATEVVPIPGGRSKKTWFISVENTDELPPELVMRQDYQLHYEGTKVRDEYEPLVKFSALQLPVPAPLLLEKSESSLGQPFMLMEKLKGSPPGSYFGLREKCPGAFRDLAKSLAQIHRTDPAEVGFVPGEEPEQNLLRLIDTYQEKWRQNSTRPSPVIDYAYAWARSVCRQDPGLVAVVHGDVGPHNMLVESDRLTALLDWEFSHVGDPAEDLGIARVYAEDVMDWDDFMRLYNKAGGPQVPARRIELAMVLHFLKGACLVAVSGRNFEEGWTREFVKGATAFAGLRQIEVIIGSLLRRFGTLK